MLLISMFLKMVYYQVFLYYLVDVDQVFLLMLLFFLVQV